MSRASLFNSPLLLGFEHFERALDRVNKGAADGYPPYNIEQTRRRRAAHHPRRRRLHDGRSDASRSRTISWSFAASRPTTRSASICIAASRRASSSAPSCSPRASRCAAPGSITACCISIWCARRSRRACAPCRSAVPRRPALPGTTGRNAEQDRIGGLRSEPIRLWAAPCSAGTTVLLFFCCRNSEWRPRGSFRAGD